jgi:glycerol uptake facilitator-like aquaporin
MAMVLSKRMKVKLLPVYWLGQFLGAFLAAGALFLLFADSIATYEATHGIIRGTPDSVNPARDLAPRAFSYLAGWKQVAFPDQNFGVLIYGLGPLLGGIIAAIFFTRIIQPAMAARRLQPGCACNPDEIA